MRLLFLLTAALLLSACSSVTARKNPSVQLGSFNVFYVEHRLNDNHATDALIAAELRSRGFKASYGPLTMMPVEAEVVITYDDRWTWDFNSYLIDLEISAHNTRTDQLIATGSYHHPGLTPKSAEKMIRAIFDEFLQ